MGHVCRCPLHAWPSPRSLPLQGGVRLCLCLRLCPCLRLYPAGPSCPADPAVPTLHLLLWGRGGAMILRLLLWGRGVAGWPQKSSSQGSSPQNACQQLDLHSGEAVKSSKGAGGAQHPVKG